MAREEPIPNGLIIQFRLWLSKIDINTVKIAISLLEVLEFNKI